MLNLLNRLSRQLRSARLTTALIPALMALFVALAVASSAPRQRENQPAVEAGTQQNRTFVKTISLTKKLGYLLYLPEGYGKKGEEETNWPLILFLHGAGERGTNLKAVKQHGPPMIVEQGKDLPFIIVSPQCPKDDWWATEVNEALLLALLDDLFERYDVDEKRVYLTGLSLGGFGTWSLAANHPDRFAAIAPICGGGDPAKARQLKRVPVWAFHGGNDRVVPPKQSEDMVEAVKKAGGDATLTIYPDVGHDSWRKAYADPALYDWFLGHESTTTDDR